MVKREFPNYNAIIELVKIATDEKTPRAEKVAANKEVANYLYPKLKAMEIRQEADNNIQISWQMPHSSVDPASGIPDLRDDGTVIEAEIIPEKAELKDG
jgi:hypothetical protein